MSLDYNKMHMKANADECIQLLICCLGVMTPEQVAEARADYFSGKERRDREQINAKRRKSNKRQK